MSAHREFLLKRKKELQEQLKPLRKLEAELEEVESLLSKLDEPKRGDGRLRVTHPDVAAIRTAIRHGDACLE